MSPRGWPNGYSIKLGLLENDPQSGMVFRRRLHRDSIVGRWGKCDQCDCHPSGCATLWNRQVRTLHG